MSKIGRKPIQLRDIAVDINDNVVFFKGPKSSGSYMLPAGLQAYMNNEKNLCIGIDKNVCKTNKQFREINKEWGLHRALLANKIIGSGKGFENQLEIRGLGYKATVSGNTVVFALGYSHKVDIVIPHGITVEVDKQGQKISVKSSDKELAGQFCSNIKALRTPDAYKGKGIKLVTDRLVLKAVGKSK